MKKLCSKKTSGELFNNYYDRRDIRIKNQQFTLNTYEKRIINLYGRIFEDRRSNNFGRIFAVLFLKARSEEEGLNQQEIASYINSNFQSKVSISTISRTLTKMYKAKYCNYKEEPSGRRKRKYFTHGSFKELSFERIRHSIKEVEEFTKEFGEIEHDLKNDESLEYIWLLETLDYLQKLYRILYDVYRDFEHTLIDKLGNL